MLKRHCKKLAENPQWSRTGSDLFSEVEKAREHVSAGRMDAAIAILTGTLLEKQTGDLYSLLALCYRAAHEPAEAQVMEELASRHA